MKKLADEPVPTVRHASGYRRWSVCLTEEEYQAVLQQKEKVGSRWADYIRGRLLCEPRETVLYAANLISQLDRIGTDLGRSAARINQLARYAGTLTAHSKFSAEVPDRFDRLFVEFLSNQRNLEQLMRRIIRLLAA